MYVFLSSLLVASACKSELDDKPSAQVLDAAGDGASAAAVAKADPGAQALRLVAESSSIEFVGAKVSGDHRGSFGTPNGSLTLGGPDEIKTLSVQVATTELQIEPDGLNKHLRGEDFFDVDKYPKASFALASASKKEGSTYEIVGDLELRGVTKRISFPGTIKFTAGKVDATASFKIKRKDFGIVYDGMADDVIKDDVLLDLKLAFSA